MLQPRLAGPVSLQKIPHHIPISSSYRSTNQWHPELPRTPTLALAGSHLYTSGRFTPQHILQKSHNRMQPRQLQSRRWLSSTGARQRMSMRIDKSVKPRTPAMQSLKGMMKEGAEKMPRAQMMPHDIGLLPGTFIHPTGARLPPWSSEPSLRWRLERKRMIAKVRDFAGLIYYKFWMLGFRHKPRPNLMKLKPFALPKLATDLHHEIFTAFADANETVLKEKCCEGILTSFKARIGQRSNNERFHWEAVYKGGLGRARVVSDRAIPLSIPGVKIPDGCALRQVVVKIKSKQKLTRYLIQPKKRAAQMTNIKRPTWRMPKQSETLLSDKEVPGHEWDNNDTEVVAGSEEIKEQDATEYFVIQQRIWERQQGPWMMWGLAEETSPESVLSLRDRKGRGASQLSSRI